MLFVYVLTGFLFFPLGGRAQHQFVFYQMDQVPQSGLLNPGYLPEQKIFVGLPLLSGGSAGLSANGFTYNQLITGNSFVFEEVDYIGLAGQAGGANQLLSSFETQLLGAGLRLGKGFVSFNISERADFNGLYPFDFMQLLGDVQEGSPRTAVPYDLSSLNVNATHYRSFSLGYAHRLDRLSAGLRLHYLNGLSNVWTINRGIRLQNTGEGDFLEVDGELFFLAAGLNGIEERPLNDYLQGSGNHGFSLDLGLTYRLSEQVELSASALNLGVIRWRNGISYRQVNEELLQVSGNDLEALGDEFGDIIDDLTTGVPADGEVRYQTPLVQQYYLGGRYFLQPQTSLGLLFNTRVSDRHVNWGASVSGSTRIADRFGLSLALSAFNQSFFNLGAGFSVELGPVQLYAASDNLFTFFRWKDAYSAQAQIGLNLHFGKMEQGTVREEPVAETEVLPALEPVPAPAPEPGPPPVQQPYAPSTYAVTEDPFGPASDNTPFLSALPSQHNTILLYGVVREEVSREILKSIVLELYTLESSGERTLVYANGFYSGRFSVPIRIGPAHVVIINKHGYRPEEVVLSTENLGDQEVIEREFTLSPVPPPPPAAREELRVRQEPEEEPLSKPATEPSADPPRPVEGKGFFDLTEATSLRKGPTHKTGVILRFSPGDRVELLEKHDRWWWRVRFKGRIGYVKAFLLVPVD